MKILIVNRFFGGAQIPTGRMAEDVARVLVERGHEMTVLASSGEYVGASRRADGIQHTVNGIRLEEVRVPTWMPRALAWLWFTWQARKRIPQMEWDVCVLMTDPPLLPLLARRIRRKAYGTRHIAVWLMDLYPEALAASGRITKSNPLYRWYFNKRQKALAASDLLLFLGETQKALVGKWEGGCAKVGRWNDKQGTVDRRQQAVGTETLSRAKRDSVSLADVGRGQPPKPLLAQRVRTAVVPPWDDRGNIAPATDESLQNLALYAGNLGEAHCFEEILAAAPYLPADWTIRFAARGAKLAALKEKAGQSGHGLTRMKGRISPPGSADRTVENAHAGGPPALAVSPPSEEAKSPGAKTEITGYASEEETPGLLASARVHLITMSPGWEGIVVPSKLYGCIRTGRPVLFIGPENADTAREIRANDWGMVLPPGASGEEVAAAMLDLAKKPTSSAQVLNGAQLVAKSLEGLAERCSPTTEH